MINLHNETSRVVYVFFIYIFFLLFVFICTRKNKIVKLQVPNIKTQMKIAILLFLIFTALNCFGLYYWIKVNPRLVYDRAIWIRIGSAIVACAGLILTLKNGERIPKIGFNFNYFYLNFGLLIPLGAMLFIPGGIEILRKGFLFFLTVFIRAIIEEVFCRAYIQSRCESYFGTTLGLLTASLLFAVMHLSTLLACDLLRSLEYFLAGLSLGILFIRTRSLAPCVLLHTFGNLFG